MQLIFFDIEKMFTTTLHDPNMDITKPKNNFELKKKRISSPGNIDKVSLKKTAFEFRECFRQT